MSSPAEITALLRQWSGGDQEARERVMSSLYDELRLLAASYLRRESGDITLQRTDLVHELFLRITQQSPIDWNSRSHFFSIAARLMRQILVEHARAGNRQKRGGGAAKEPLSGLVENCAADVPLDPAEVLEVDRALARLEAIDPQRSHLVELRYYGGFSIPETAQILGSSPATVKRDWNVARLFLLRELKGDAGAAGEME